MKANVKPKQSFTHEGAPSKKITPEQQLRRYVMSCLLWEKEFYEEGESIADRILESASKCSPEFVAQTATEARNKFHLRHVPLLLLKSLAYRDMQNRSMVADAVFKTISRPDEMGELISMIIGGSDKRVTKNKIPRQVRVGIARAFEKFDAYQLGKYNRQQDGVTLRDVLFIAHPKPKDDKQAGIWKKLANNQLESPDTWEVALSAGADKKETFERLLRDRKIGYMALLRNLRGMLESGVDDDLIKASLLARGGADRVLPFRFIAAAKHAPRLEAHIDQAMTEALGDMPKLSGKTLLMVDVSGSMDAPLSAKSDLNRLDAACGLAILLRGVCEDVQIITFSYRAVEIPPRHGMALRDAILQSQPHGGTDLAGAVRLANSLPHDRLVVISDEQASGRVPDPVAKLAYMMNVASFQNGIGYHRWVHVDGFSESCVNFISEHELTLAQ